MPGGGGKPFPSAGGEERIKAALGGRNAELLRMIANKPGSGHARETIVVDRP